MASLSLRINVVDNGITKTIQFDPSISVERACHIIHEKVSEVANLSAIHDYGLYLPDEENRRGVWMEANRNLDYYLLRNLDVIEFRKKSRTLKVRMLDGAVKTVMIDDSQSVSALMPIICAKVGITNHDEYGLLRDNAPAVNGDDGAPAGAGNTGTIGRHPQPTPSRSFVGLGTIPRKREEQMNQLRKKLKTDDELNWVNMNDTLHHQGVLEGEAVTLRKKYFFSDGNVDSHDPVQLNLLYVQTRDAIINGTHPVTEEMAVQLAGLQAHIQFGSYNQEKHKQSLYDLKEFLPRSYAKVRAVDKKIVAQHAKNFGRLEVDAKVEYTRLCRSLPTYGVTFFLVREKLDRKQKLVPRLLGVNKESVLRLDEHTKEILKVWPLTTVRRWAATSQTLTLDFGDYADSYYSVQTKDGEQIKEIIAGYIDIILKRQKAKEYQGAEGDENATMMEEMVAPSKASVMHSGASPLEKINTESLAKPGIMRDGAGGRQHFTTNCFDDPMYSTVNKKPFHVNNSASLSQHKQTIDVEPAAPQKGLVTMIAEGREAIKAVHSNLTAQMYVPQAPSSSTYREQSITTSKLQISSHMAAMNAATAQIITKSSVSLYDDVAIEDAIHSITTYLPQISHNVRMIAALEGQSTDNGNMLAATQQLCDAFANLLNTMQPNSKTNHQNIINTAGKVGDLSNRLIFEVGTLTNENDLIKDLLLSAAKGVATATASLVLRAKEIAKLTSSGENFDEIIESATICALATSQLVACTKVVAPTVNEANCAAQLALAAKEVMRAMQNLVGTCASSIPPQFHEPAMSDLNNAVTEVTAQLNKLIDQVKYASRVQTKSPSTLSTSSTRTYQSGRENRVNGGASPNTNDFNGYSPTNEGHTTTSPQSNHYPSSEYTESHHSMSSDDFMSDVQPNRIDPVEANHNSNPTYISELKVMFSSPASTNPTAAALNQPLHIELQPVENGLGSRTPNGNPPPSTKLELAPPTQKAVYDISEAMARVSNVDPTQIHFAAKKNNSTIPPQEYHLRMVNDVKSIAKGAQEMLSQPWNEEENQAPRISQCYSQLSNDCLDFMATEIDLQIKSALIKSVENLGGACTSAIQVASTTRVTDPCPYSSPERNEQAKKMATTVSNVIKALHSCSQGTIACNRAVTAAAGVVADLETIITFADLGTLDADNENETFLEHREHILRAAKVLTEDTKLLVQGGASSQEQLARAAQKSVTTLASLSEKIKAGASSLGSQNNASQVMLINATKDAATALSSLIQAMRDASGKLDTDPSMETLKSASHIMIKNLMALLQTVRSVEDEHSRGTLALRSTIDGISQEIQTARLVTNEAAAASPEELIRCTKAITLATAAAVAAGNSATQEDIMKAANVGRKCIRDFLSASEGCAAIAETPHLKEKTIEVSRGVANEYRNLLLIVADVVKPNVNHALLKQNMYTVSRSIAQKVAVIVATAEELKGDDWVQPDDPTVKAEHELLVAAASIDAAAKKLASLRPRPPSNQQVAHHRMNPTMQFNEMIIQAAKSITAANYALIEAATNAQRELVETGRVSRVPLNHTEDGQWSEGLISAAKLVATATHSLVESANDLVNGDASSEERVISSAKQVASSTAHLLVACTVKADPHSESTKRLRMAGKAVKSATDNLVKSAQNSVAHDDERRIMLSKKRVNGLTQMIDARTKVLQAERELEEARSRLAAINMAQNKFHKLKQQQEEDEDDFANFPPPPPQF